MLDGGLKGARQANRQPAQPLDAPFFESAADLTVGDHWRTLTTCEINGIGDKVEVTVRDEAVAVGTNLRNVQVSRQLVLVNERVEKEAFPDNFSSKAGLSIEGDAHPLTSSDHGRQTVCRIFYGRNRDSCRAELFGTAGGWRAEAF